MKYSPVNFETPWVFAEKEKTLPVELRTQKENNGEREERVCVCVCICLCVCVCVRVRALEIGKSRKGGAQTPKFFSLFNNLRFLKKIISIYGNLMKDRISVNFKIREN